MAIEPIKADLIWEDNPDTPLNSYNLSKVIDYQTESKFIYYANTDDDYELWADLVIAGNINDYAREEYVGQVIYHRTDFVAKIIVDNGEGVYSADDYNSPYNKLLKIKSKTKITLDFEKDDIVYYNSFDTGIDDKVFTSDHLITEVDFQTDTTYHIYLYYHISYGDYCQIKIMNETETAWMTAGGADPSSPSGHKIISYRKIGGFKTDLNGYIIEDSVWDVSTYRKELLIENFKKFDNGSIRNYSALDIPIEDSEEILASEDVENALREIKSLTDRINDDTYTTNRFGVELKYSAFKKESSQLEECITHDITLKITNGYIDVYGERVKFDDDVYIASSDVSIRINDDTTNVTTAILGEQGVNKIYDSSQTGDGTIWRVYIDILGRILLKENSVVRPQFMNEGKLKGWYDLTSVARCIGKFKVNHTGIYYIEKQSVTQTFETIIPTNTIFTFHGTMCPDGLIPCDGKWHDVNGLDQSSWEAMPVLNSWKSGSWYEETPNLYNRTVKMPNKNTFNTAPFELDVDRTVLHGGSVECGVEGGNETHTHTYNHDHGPGTLQIDSSGAHTHEGTEIQFPGFVDENETVLVDAGTSVRVTMDTHDHTLIIGGGDHVHHYSDLSGNVESLTSAVSGATNNWAPYKEILFCIKK